MHVQLVYPHVLHEALHTNLVVKVQFSCYYCSTNSCNRTDIALDQQLCSLMLGNRSKRGQVILPQVPCPLYEQTCFRRMLYNRKKNQKTNLSLELHFTEAEIAFGRKLSSISLSEAVLQNQKTGMEEHIKQTQKSKVNSRNQRKLMQQQYQHQTRGNWIIFSSPPSVS